MECGFGPRGRCMTSLEIVRPPTATRAVRIWRAAVALSKAPATAGGAEGQAEKLVLEFDEAYTAFVDGFSELPTEGQLLSLQAVDNQVASMVAMKDASVWTESAHRDSESWTELRSRASRVLSEFDWPDHTT